jgi:hypothetical protein
MISRKEAQERMRASRKQYSKAQIKSWLRVQDRVQDLMIEYLEQEFELTPVYYGVLAEAIVKEVVDSKIKAVPADAPNVLLSDKEWIESLMIDCKQTLLTWDESGKAEQIIEQWEHKQERIKHGV